MAKGLASLIAALGAGMGGYAKGNQMFNDEERRQRRDQREEEEYQFQREARDKQRNLDRDLAASQKDESVSPVTNTGATYTDEDLIAADNRENRRNAEQLGQPAPAPMTATSFNAAGTNYGDRGAAQAALYGVNSQAMKDQRAAQVMRQHGQIEKARQYEEFAKKAIDEGTDKILVAISAAAPTVEAVKTAGGTVAGVVGQEAADIFNKTGGRWKVSPETVVQHFIDKDAAGREFVNSRVIGKDGRPVVDDVRSATMMLTDIKTRLEQQNRDAQLYQTGQRDAEHARHNKAQEGELARHNKAAEGLSASQVAISRERLDMDKKTFKKQSLEGQLDEIEKVMGPLSPEDRKAYGKKLLGIGGKDLDEGMIKDMTKKWSENNPAASPKEIANFKDGLTKALTAIKTNAQVEDALRSDFGNKQPGTPEYAQVYNEAKAQLRMTDAQLNALGYATPKAAKQTRAIAQTGTAMPSQSGPSYDGWMATRKAIDDLQATAAKMSPDRREAYLAARLPDLQAKEQYHAAYNRY